MLSYLDINPRKKAFIFELDNVIYPEKDYLLQVYYLFSNFIEYTESYPPAPDLLSFFKTAYQHHGAERLFDRAAETFGIDAKYNVNFKRLHLTAKLPLKLVLYPYILKLLQELVIDRKQLFIVTNGDPEQQLNKIRQTEWYGLENYLTVYFANEIKPKPDTDVLSFILDQYDMKRRDLVVIGNSVTDEDFASASGIDYILSTDFA